MNRQPFTSRLAVAVTVGCVSLAACAAPSDPQPAPTKAGWEQRIIQIPGHRMHAERETI